MVIIKIFDTFGFSGVKQSISILTIKTVWKACTESAVSTDTKVQSQQINSLIWTSFLNLYQPHNLIMITWSRKVQLSFWKPLTAMSNYCSDRSRTSPSQVDARFNNTPAILWSPSLTTASQNMAGSLYFIIALSKRNIFIKYRGKLLACVRTVLYTTLVLL